MQIQVDMVRSIEWGETKKSGDEIHGHKKIIIHHSDGSLEILLNGFVSALQDDYEREQDQDHEEQDPPF